MYVYIFFFVHAAKLVLTLRTTTSSTAQTGFQQFVALFACVVQHVVVFYRGRPAVAAVVVVGF